MSGPKPAEVSTELIGAMSAAAGVPLVNRAIGVIHKAAMDKPKSPEPEFGSELRRREKPEHRRLRKRNGIIGASRHRRFGGDPGFGRYGHACRRDGAGLFKRQKCGSTRVAWRTRQPDRASYTGDVRLVAVAAADR